MWLGSTREGLECFLLVREYSLCDFPVEALTLGSIISLTINIIDLYIAQPSCLDVAQQS
jgi:hypothetical protein